jgi:hypothetical protein
LGEQVSRIFLPEVNTSTVSSSWAPIDLLTQRQQLLAGLLEGVHQLGVARRQRVDPGFQLLHLTGTRAAGSALQLVAQTRRLTAQLFQFGDVPVVVGTESFRS